MSELHVVFGTGRLGRYTATTLLEMGHTVRLINRSGQMADAPAGAEIIAGDAYDAAWNREVTLGATAVYRCAQPHYHEWAEKFPSLQRAILAGVAANGAKLIVGDKLATLGTRAEALGQVWFAPSNPPITQAQFARLVEEALGQQVKSRMAGPLYPSGVVRGWGISTISNTPPCF